MAWCLVKHRDNFTLHINFSFNVCQYDSTSSRFQSVAASISYCMLEVKVKVKVKLSLCFI